MVSSLINFNLRGGSLRHCLAVSKCKGVMLTKELNEPIAEIQSMFTEVQQLQMYCFDEGEVQVKNSIRYVYDD